MKYMIVAGEASGDLHGSRLIRALRGEDEESEIRFIGGDLMAAEAGHAPLLHYDCLNVMGFAEVIRHLPSIWRNLRLAKRILREYNPDILILVDFPGFNLKLAGYARKLGIMTDYYISPKLWAWKEWRIKGIKRDISHIYSILPFEPEYYRRLGYDRVTYVGNPSVEEIDYVMGHISPLRHFMERQGFSDERPIIALLPGSRLGEIRKNLPLMIEAAKRYSDFQYIVAAAASIPEKFYREVAQDPGLKVAFGATPTLVKYSRAALVTSGTATLETALVGTPQVVCYRANGQRWTYKLMEHLLKVKYVSLPNLIAGNAVVPELLLHKCTVANICRELTPLLQPSPKRDWEINGYRMIRRKLGTSAAAHYAAELIVAKLRKLNSGDSEKAEK